MLAGLLSKPMLMLGLVVVGLIALAVVARNWSCRQPKPPPRPRTETFDVVTVPTGASIEVATGLRGRRTAVVTLSGIAAPAPGEPLAEQSRANLERVAGSTVRIEWQRGLLRSDNAQDGLRQQEPEEDPIQATAETTGQDEQTFWKTTEDNGTKWTLIRRLCTTCMGEGKVEPPPFMTDEYRKTHKWKCAVCEGCPQPGWIVVAYRQDATDAPPGPPEARPPGSGVVYGISGACLQVEQVERGLARCLPDAPKAWQAAEAEAKKNKRGQWSQ